MSIASELLSKMEGSVKDSMVMVSFTNRKDDATKFYDKASKSKNFQQVAEPEMFDSEYTVNVLPKNSPTASKELADLVSEFDGEVIY